MARLEVETGYSVVMDEFWSYVGNKQNQRWTWYAIEKNSGVILAYHNGKRTDECLKALLNKMSHFPINAFYTDDWGAYNRLLKQAPNYIGKHYTQKIERKNLNFRTHLKRLQRKTICFSKNEQIHDNMIGMYTQP